MDYNAFYGTIVTSSGQIRRGTALTAVMNAITNRAKQQAAPSLMTAVAEPQRSGDEPMLRDKYRRLLQAADPSVPTPEERAESATTRPRTDASTPATSGAGRFRFTPSRFRR